eukprot:GDKJ01049860.1.p1 GENE.GDKJ01049860.1~~GDKJ01049860.1.p1  ORF type:complete len:173 (+),score=27.77 GDKJ01049860.1:24-521(+)
MANRRLLKEYIDSRKAKDPEIRLIASRDNLSEWRGFIAGPADTPYHGRVFEMKIEIPTDYPMKPPLVHFVTPVFHPNVHWTTGELCVDILKESWSPAWSLNSVCRAVLALFHDPNHTSPLNCDAANLLKASDRLAFNSLARMYAVELGLDSFPTFPADDEYPAMV